MSARTIPIKVKLSPADNKTAHDVADRITKMMRGANALTDDVFENYKVEVYKSGRDGLFHVHIVEPENVRIDLLGAQLEAFRATLMTVADRMLSRINAPETPVAVVNGRTRIDSPDMESLVEVVNYSLKHDAVLKKLHISQIESGRARQSA